MASVSWQELEQACVNRLCLDVQQEGRLLCSRIRSHGTSQVQYVVEASLLSRIRHVELCVQQLCSC